MKFTLKYSFILIIVLFIFFSSFSFNVLSDEQYNSTDIDNLAYKQEIKIPIDTSLEISKFQPIDMRIEFSNPCWAKDETHHSVRVGFDDGSCLTEIDSQIYDLEYSDDTNIKSCSLVFIIPTEANGKEKYYVLYDSSETDASDYEDHITLEDSHYFYEPIPGQTIDFDYFGIYQDGYVIYAPIQIGEIIGYPVAQTVAKAKPESTEVETNTIDQLAHFDLRYGIEGTPDYAGPSAAVKANKNILVDGNLMARLRIECYSPQGDIRSDNIYTYYFCPTDTKRLYVDVNHEVFETIDIPDPDILDGTYTGFVTTKSRSKTIEKMNVGNILPSLNIYDEDESIKEYYVPPDPDSIEKEVILSTEDDVDLGSKGWISLSDPETDKTHAIIMESNTGFTDGDDDGIQIKSYVKQNIKLPGLEGDTGNVFLTRNTYEKGGSHDTVLPEGFKIHFGVEFYTDEDEGYEKVDAESEIFQTLIKTVPIFKENVTDGEDEDEERYSLTTFVHLAPSAPMGSLLSAALGRNIPYISAELYKEGSFKSSGSVGRLPLGAIDLDLAGKSISQLIQTVTGLFDFKNASLFKKIKFPDLEPGTYVVKIYRENLLFNRERQYIGFKIVDLKNDEKIRIFCRPQASIKLSISDQNKNAIENVKFCLESNGISIEDGVSDENGTVIIKAPCHPTKPYTLKVIYQGFLVEEKNIKLGLINRLIQKKDSFSIEYHKLNFKLKDKWGFAPAIEVNPSLTSNDMVELIRIPAEKITEGEYHFINLYPATYLLNMKYKSFEVEEEVLVGGDNFLELTFPAEYELDFNVMNYLGDRITDGEIFASRNGKKEKVSINENGNGKITVPPGEYELSICLENEEIAKQKVNVLGEKEIDIVTSHGSFFHIIVLSLGILLAIFSVLFIIWKRKFSTGLKLILISLLIIALVSPWWVLNGDDGTTSTTTQTLLYPPRIVTLSSSKEIIGGYVSQVPAEVTMVLSLLSMLLAISSLLMFLTIFTKDKLRKTTIIFSILSIILIIFTIFIFFYVMGQITEVGVGSFMGSGDINTSLPGIAESKILPSNWGPGIGFYLGILVFIIIVLTTLYKRFKPRFFR